MIKSMLENKMTAIIGILCFIGSVCIIGYTYSFFVAEVTNAVTIKGDAASPSINLSIDRVAPSEDKKLIPQLDGVIHKAVIGTQGNCLDDNHNAVCQVYKVTIKNTSTIATYMSSTLLLDDKDNPHLKWAIVSGLSNTSLKSDIKTVEDTILINNELYAAGEIKDYYVVLWISETGVPQTDSGSFNGTVTVESISKNPSFATLTKLGITAESENLTAFSGNSKQDGTTGVYATEDDLGTSYYFRGNVTNNYVKFGKYTEDAWQVYDPSTGISTYASTCTSGGNISCIKIASANDDMYWRIVRINGDGTVRMIYAGTSAHPNAENVDSIGFSPYNINHNDNAYVGYMYGTPGSTTYDETHANTNNSLVKTAVELWYSKYLNTNYGNYVADAIYCNDRTLVTDSSKNLQLKFLVQNLLNENKEMTGQGYGTYGTGYSTNNRTDFENFIVYPTLKCQRWEDRFTDAMIIGNTFGNGALNYPIALLNVDELVFAGSFLDIYSDGTYYNDESYLNFGANSDYWVMTPSMFAASTRVYFAKKGTFYVEITSVSCGIRPVISLKADAIIGGTGILTDPFTIS